MSVEKVREYLTPYGVADRMREFEVSSATVELAALAVGVEGARIAKTLSFKVGEDPILIVAGGHDEDGILPHLEAEGLGNAGALHANGQRGQLHRGAGHVKFTNTVSDAVGFQISSYFFNRHGDDLLYD